MATTKLEPSRKHAAARLRRLLAALGFSQREMAAELRVAHGAVGLWESGARPIPGPVLKLMELFEEELGLAGASAKSLTSWTPPAHSEWCPPSRGRISAVDGGRSSAHQWPLELSYPPLKRDPRGSQEKSNVDGPFRRL